MTTGGQQALSAIATWAERGLGVRVGLSVGILSVWGVPVPRAEFFEKVQHRVAGDAFRAKKLKKSQKDEEWRRTYAEYEDFFGNLSREFPTEPGALLYFVEPAVVHASGAGGTPPGFAVPIEQVQAWWYGDPSWKAPSSGGNWFVGGGVAVPLDI